VDEDVNEDRQRLTLDLDLRGGADVLARAIAPLVANAIVRQLQESPSTLSAQPRVLLTVEQAAERLAISRTVVYSLIKSGELESVKIGNIRRIPAAAVDDFVQRLREEPDESPT
jgi:excisionase family DNA binding protein